MEKSKLSNIKRYLFSGIVVKLISIFLGAVFVYAAVPKILDLNNFFISVDNYQIVPEFLIPYFAILLVSLELVVGILLILGIYRKEAAIITIFLNIIFIIALTAALIRGIDISCGCFSNASESVSINTIIRDLFFIFLAYTILFCKDNDEKRK